MKKTIFAAAMVAALGLNASALYFDGGVTGTTGPDGYRGTKLDLIIGEGDLAFNPSMTSYTSDALDKTYRTWGLRGAWESDKYTIGGEAGLTPEVNGYENKYVGGDITISLTPTSGGKARLAGPGARSTARGGEGVARVDIGAALKHTMHTQTAGTSDLETAQTAATLFAGAKVLMLNLSASYTGYSYGDEDALPQGFTPGHTFVTSAKPRSSVNARVDIPSTLPMVTPFAGYTVTKYKGGSAAAETDESSAILLGGYVDLNMVVANVTYQILNYAGNTDSFVSIGAGIKF
ncbi:MAG TPA: hypothetical protein DCW72_04580 [Elusimicrobia bacterium]|nr:MAG: hypothetical protein A2X29_01755 [Elusimicrobia bacterium GWA2_64_40]OGR63829.1 MAG: hypothetical protein A2X30_07650 [Elusimicrobia bacterium GWB2_63_16]HAN04893.1 hypothetical protein [Elusimicrobiota bacterium]HAU89520.1 hypothetical protein [Elusimicrobiota bacterium]